MNIDKLILDSEDRFEVISIDRQYESIVINVTSNSSEGFCPLCEKRSCTIRSYYTRRFEDLPAFGKPCRILLKTKKFKCCTKDCPVKVFAERFTDHFEHYQRRTNRLAELLGSIAVQSGGKPGERLCDLLSISVSDTTLLRLVMKKSLPVCNGVIALGVDDWAMKKRDRYGSILVDLNTNKSIGLLPDREEKTLCSWLKNQPKIKFISRDRYSKYKRAITKGAPQAHQIADRWHLLSNLNDDMRKLLDRQHSVMRKVREMTVNRMKPPHQAPEQELPGRKQQMFKQVKLLIDQGVPIRKIARTLKGSRNTIKSYKYKDELPHREYRLPSGFEEQIPYIKERISANPQVQLKELFTEIRMRGYWGAYSTLSENLRHFNIRSTSKDNAP
jgi:transposase